VGLWDTAALRCRRAESRRRLRDFDGAHADVNEALRLFPRYTDALMSRALSFLDSSSNGGGSTVEHYDAARVALEAVLAVDRGLIGIDRLLIAAASREHREREHVIHEEQSARILKGSTRICQAWRQTGSCRANGPREPLSDRSCAERVPESASGYCECSGVAALVLPLRVQSSDCGHEPFTCGHACARAFAEAKSTATTATEEESTAGGDDNNNHMIEKEEDEEWTEAGYWGWEANGDAAGATEDPFRWVTSTDHYSVLALPIDFTPDELKRAFRQASKRYHPDKQEGSNAAFQRIASAHATLGDVALRDQYDRGDDLPKETPEHPSFAEDVERKYFPERFDFHPFGDPWEGKRKREENTEKRQVEQRQRLEDHEAKKAQIMAENAAAQAERNALREAERWAHEEAVVEQESEL
jgi:hypothetical protein